MDSVDTPELGASFDKADCMPTSMSSGFLCSVPFLIILDCILFLSLNVINYGAGLGHYFYLYYWHIKCQPLRLFFTFRVIQQHLDSGLLCNLITSL